MAHTRSRATAARMNLDNPSPGSLSTARFLGIAIVAACLSSAVRLSLTPIYGQLSNDIVVSIYATAFVFLELLVQLQLNEPKLETCLSLLPLYMSLIPSILHFILFRLSLDLGPYFGPSVTDTIICSPLIWILFQSQRRLHQHMHYGRWLRMIAEVAVYVIVFTSGRYISSHLEQAIVSFALVTRTTLLIYLACIACLVRPSKHSGWIIIPMAYVILSNPHLPSRISDAQLNRLLQPKGFFMLERTESKTGYISVLENRKDGFRALRCDHSLLGGNWLSPVTDNASSTGSADPIFGVFTMLEAVRLMNHADESHLQGKKDSRALVIGLGVGTCPSALSTHGIHTTVVELDPAVTYFATKYFGLLENVTVINEDAVTFAENAGPDNYTYDYIVHDVFTGGAEPAALFTVQFLQSLHERLDVRGYIAINYAGDLNQTPAVLALRTIHEVFKQCRVFRDHLPEAGGSDGDFANMVIFCAKHDTPWNFRTPRPSDFLSSSVRKEHLLPRYEISKALWHSRVQNVQIIDKGRLSVLEQFRQDGLHKHWHIMRTVLPSTVWELW